MESNNDFYEEPVNEIREEPQMEPAWTPPVVPVPQAAEPPKKTGKKKRRGGCGCGLAAMALCFARWIPSSAATFPCLA